MIWPLASDKLKTSDFESISALWVDVSKTTEEKLRIVKNEYKYKHFFLNTPKNIFSVFLDKNFVVKEKKLQKTPKYIYFSFFMNKNISMNFSAFFIYIFFLDFLKKYF